MRIRYRLVFLSFLFLLTWAWAADQYEVTIERNVQVKMRDRVILRAAVFRPKAEGKFPVLLERTPCNKPGDDFGWRSAAHGYVVIIQDVRGRYSSEGEW